MAHQQKSYAEPIRRQTGITRNMFFLTIALVAVTSFVAGTRQDELLGAIGPALGVEVATGTIDVSSLQDTYRQLEANYDGELDIPALIEGANRGLVEAVGDNYTAYMSSKEAEQFDRDLSGDIGGGIGAEIGVRNDQPTILRTLSDAPAEKAGLKAGDIILSVNNTITNGWAADKTAEAIRGEVGTTVKLLVFRGVEEKEFSITRAHITNPSVEAEMKDGLGVLKISRFDGETATLARRAAESFKQQGARGVVVDLRGNGGGYLTASQDVAGMWLDNKVIVSERRGGKVTQELRSKRNPVFAGMPTVVLVNQASASASEIVAGALQDYDAATIMGETTFGKGTVQKLVSLGDGAELKVTIARWYTPEGRNISEEGIEPDEKIERSFDDINANRDPQLDAAIKLLKG